MERLAYISACERYRYWLTRKWGEGSKFAGFIMLNPSTADASIDDPTIRRCIGFAKSWGCDGIRVVNLFAIRATDPKGIRIGVGAVGPDNDLFILQEAARCQILVAAWGAHGTYQSRDRKVVLGMRRAGFNLKALGWTAKGHPRHPLYMPADAELVDFPLPVEASHV